jgi:glycosyltransferase involved in cell wall biosynthesis
MKLVLFAHTPPPIHGQSMMVGLMLRGLGGDRLRAASAANRAQPPAPEHGIECYHVNARLSSSLEDIGRVRVGKVLRILGYCGRALWARFRHGARTLYYVPSPPKRSSLYRDWVVMVLCRWAFRRVIFHWHGVGLGEWLERRASWVERRITHWLLDRVDLAIVLSSFNLPDAEKFCPRAVKVVANGIADPCPDYHATLAAHRAARAVAREKLQAGIELSASERKQAGDEPQLVRVVFVAHCVREKGLFEAVNGVELANRQLAAQQSPLRLGLTVAGQFLAAEDRAEFDRLAAVPSVAGWLKHLGFVTEPEKWTAFREADVFCFPTYYANEGQPANLIEAMAHGLPVVTTRWRSIPEFLPPGYAGLIEPRQPEAVAAALLAVMNESGEAFRATFERHFTLKQHLSTLAAALRSVAPDPKNNHG